MAKDSVSIEEVADNGGRARRHGRGDYAAGGSGSTWSRTACHVRRARAAPPPVAEDAMTAHVDMRFNQKPRVRIEDQEGAPRVAPEETEAAKSALDAAFEAEASMQRAADAEHAAMLEACIRRPTKYGK